MVWRSSFGVWMTQELRKTVFLLLKECVCDQQNASISAFFLERNHGFVSYETVLV